MTILAVYHSNCAGWHCWTWVESLFCCSRFWLCFLCLSGELCSAKQADVFTLHKLFVIIHFREPITSSGSLLKLLHTDLSLKKKQTEFFGCEHIITILNIFTCAWQTSATPFLCVLKVKGPVVLWVVLVLFFFFAKNSEAGIWKHEFNCGIMENFDLYRMAKLHS